MTGSGFFYKHSKHKRPFLITNYHVATARFPKEPESLIKKEFGSSPNKLKCHVWGFNPLKGHTFNIILDSSSPWLEHPKRNEGVDIVGIPVILPEHVPIVTQNEIQCVDNIPFAVASDLYIVGYPNGLAVSKYLPIWKKGSVASEPEILINGLPCFYIDANTREGMSGSPVFAVETHDALPLSKEVYELIENHKKGHIDAIEVVKNLTPDIFSKSFKQKKFKFIGIYSGRATIGNAIPDIGIVWKKSLIDEMFEHDNFVMPEYPPYE